MSLLDDLKKQAQEKSAQQTQDLSKTLQQHELNWHKLAPKLFIMMNYFKDVGETLNVVQPDETNHFNITKNFALKGLKKRNFRIMKDKEGSGRTFSFRYDLAGEAEHRAAINNPASVERMRRILMEEKIKFSEIPESQNRVVFLIKPLVTTSFTYVADAEHGTINLTIRNYDGIMSQLIRYQPENITDELLDETVKFILNRDNRFMELSGYAMSDELRQKLQEKIQQGKQKKEKAAQETQDLLDTTLNKFSSIFKK